VPFAVTAAASRGSIATRDGLWPAELAFGLWLAYQIGFVHGLFSAAPHWSPQ
jgi:hypothetical protein